MEHGDPSLDIVMPVADRLNVSIEHLLRDTILLLHEQGLILSCN